MNRKFSLIPILLLLGLSVVACREAEPAVSTPAVPTSPPPTATVTAEPTAEPPTPTTEPPATPRPLSTIAPSPEPAPTLSSEASSDMAEPFLPQCDRRPPEIERPTQIHPETGESWFRYANDEYGFAFLFPPEWELLEGNNYLCLNYRANREIKLIVGYKWANDRDISIIRTGVAAGELVTTGQLDFLGREIDRNVLRYEGKDKAILYDNASHIRGNDLFFTLSIDDFRMDYDLAELPPEVMSTADAIVESFELIDRLYVNETYGFAFTLPPEWRILPDGFSNILRLSYRPDRLSGTILTIGFKWEEEEIPIMRTGTGELDELIEGEIEFMGRTIRRDVWRYEGNTTAVFYANAAHINVNGLIFTLSLDYHDPTYTGREILPEAMVSADAIVESFRLTNYRSPESAFQFAIPPGYCLYEYEHPEAALVLSLYEESAIVSEQIHKPEIFVAIHHNPDELDAQAWLAAHTADAVTDLYPIYVNPRNPQAASVANRAALTFEDMTWSHALVTLIEGNGYILAAGYTPYAHDSLAEVFTELLTSLRFDE
jgi:hypothetical protein